MKKKIVIRMFQILFFYVVVPWKRNSQDLEFIYSPIFFYLFVIVVTGGVSGWEKKKLEKEEGEIIKTENNKLYIFWNERNNNKKERNYVYYFFFSSLALRFIAYMHTTITTNKHQSQSFVISVNHKAPFHFHLCRQKNNIFFLQISIIIIIWREMIFFFTKFFMHNIFTISINNVDIKIFFF